MVEKDNVLREQFKFTGLGDFKGAYGHAHTWLSDEGFDITEDKYKEKIKGDEKEIEVVWTATKKITDYFKIELAIKWEIKGMSEVEVEIDGKKKRMNNFAELKMTIKGILVKDYDNRWEVSRMHKFMKDVYHKYIVPGRIEQKQIEVSLITKDYKDEMKAFFDLTARRNIERP